MKKEDIQFLIKLLDSLEEAEEVLNFSFKTKDRERFNLSKSFIIQVQRAVDKITR